MAKPIHVPGVQPGFGGQIIQVRKSEASTGGYYLRLIARNRQIRMASQRYPTRAHARRAAAHLVTAMREGPVVIVAGS